MCTPAIAITAVGAGISAYGAYQQGNAQSKSYEYQAREARTEAGLATEEGEQQSSFAQESGAQQTKLLKMRQAEVEGQQKVALLSNVGGGSRTAADVTSDTLNKEQMDQLAVKYNADMESWHATNEAKLRSYGLNRQAMGYDAAASESKSAGKMGAFNSLLGGAGQVAGQWAQYKQYAPSKGFAGPTAFGKSDSMAPPNYYMGRIRG